MNKSNQITKVKVNHHNNGFWVVPTLQNLFFSLKISTISIKKFDKLIDIVNSLNLQNREVVFNFNGDKQFKKFNLLTKLRGFDFQLNINEVQKLDNSAKILFEPVKNCKIYFDKKGLTLIHKGLIPFFSKNYYQNLLIQALNEDSKQQVCFYWRFFGFKKGQ